MKLLLNILGIFVILFLMWLLSYKKKNVEIKIVIKGLIVELIVAFILVKIPAGRAVLGAMLGMEGEYIQQAGQLLGSKLVLNEFIAFADLGAVIKKYGLPHRSCHDCFTQRLCQCGKHGADH